MRFFEIFKFSFKSTIRKKSYIISSAIMIILIAVAMCVPTIIDLFKSDGDSSEAEPGEVITEPDTEPNDVSDWQKTIAIIDPDGLIFADLDTLSAYLSGYSFITDILDEDVLWSKIENEEIYAALVVRDRMNVDFLNSPSIGMFSADITGSINYYMQNMYRAELLGSYDIPDEEQSQFFISPYLNFIQVGTPSYAGFAQAMIFLMAIYISVMMCAQMVATSVAQEKSTRSMEMLITTAKPTTLMFGKLFGVGLSGLVQMLSFVLTGVLFYLINKPAMSAIAPLEEMLSISPDKFIYFFLFFIGGYFIYSTLYAALGSIISRVEDLQSVQAPLILFIVAGLLIAVYGPMYGFSDTIFYKICSYIPLTSPYVMLTRIFMENIAVWEIVVSISILFLSIFGAGYLSAKIYRMGVLMYGVKPTMRDVFKNLKNQ